MSPKKTTQFGKELGSLLRGLRKQHGLTQIELASKLSINYRHYQDIEAGRTDVRIGTVNHIVSLFNLDLIKLMEMATKPELLAHTTCGVHTAPVGIAETNGEGLITYANQTYHTQLDYEFPDVVGRPLFDMVPNSQRSETKEWYNHVIENEPRPKVKAVQLRQKDGSDIMLNMTWSYFRGFEGSLIGLTAVFYDPKLFSLA